MYRKTYNTEKVAQILVLIKIFQKLTGYGTASRTQFYRLKAQERTQKQSGGLFLHGRAPARGFPDAA